MIHSQKDIIFDKIKTIYSKYGFLIILAIMVIISSILSPAFLSTRNLLNVLRQMSIITIIAFGTTMVITAGMIDLSSGSVAALTGVLATSAYVATNSLIVGLMVGLVAGAVIGFTSGFFITHFKLPPFIVTLAMMTGARGLVLLYTGGKPIINIGNFTLFGQGILLGIPLPILIMLFIFFFTLLIVKRKDLEDISLP